MDWFRTVLGRDRDRLAALPRARTHARAATDAVTRCEELARDADPGSWVALGHAWIAIDAADEAADAYQRALALAPGDADALAGLAYARREQGLLAEAIALGERAIAAQPAHVAAFQNLLFALLCSDRHDDASVLEWHRRYAARFEAPLAGERRPHVNPRDPARRLRIGYVSPDFRRHIVGRCIAPVIEHHDRSGFEVVCYHSNILSDDVTQTIRAAAGAWREVARLDDAALAQRVRDDAIDLLVDLSGHTPGNRLRAFARKPAPVQLSYLDYSATTGLQAMDARLTDARCDPPGEADRFYTERLVRLPRSFWIYNPPPLPEQRQEPGKAILFGCLNSFYRVSDAVLALWADIVARVPDSRLALVGIPPGQARRRVANALATRGVVQDRIEFFGLLDYETYTALIGAVDVALAPFPYNGAMTLLDCLWGGLPVVALRGGATFRSRMAHSIYATLGLEELLAADAASYTEAAVRLAGDASRRKAYRLGLRARVQGSALCDYGGFTRELESAYRSLWHDWCARPGGS